MINIFQGRTNRFSLTLSEKITYDPVFFTFQFIDIFGRTVTVNLQDISEFPDRYNEFIFTDTSDGTILASGDNPPAGYFVYEQPSDTSTLDGSSNLLESGIYLYFRNRLSDAVYEPSIYTQGGQDTVFDPNFAGPDVSSAWAYRHSFLSGLDADDHPQYLKEASLGDKFFFDSSGLLDVSVGGGTGDVTQLYVDGSLAARDASLEVLFNQNLSQDASIIDLAAAILDVSAARSDAWNGLTKEDNSIGLGGALNKNTKISTGLYTLEIDGSGLVSIKAPDINIEAPGVAGAVNIEGGDYVNINGGLGVGLGSPSGPVAFYGTLVQMTDITNYNNITVDQDGISFEGVPLSPSGIYALVTETTPGAAIPIKHRLLGTLAFQDASSIIPQAWNGLTTTNASIGLGGNLVQNTGINVGTFDLSINQGANSDIFIGTYLAGNKLYLSSGDIYENCNGRDSFALTNNITGSRVQTWIYAGENYGADVSSAGIVLNALNTGGEINYFGLQNSSDNKPYALIIDASDNSRTTPHANRYSGPMRMRQLGTLAWADDASLSAKLNRTTDTFTGLLTVDGSIYITGNIIQNGSTYIINAENIETKADFITLREGAIVGLIDPCISGLRITKPNGITDVLFGADASAVLRIGWDGDEFQAIATREDNPTGGWYAEWDASTQKFITKDLKGYVDGSLAIRDSSIDYVFENTIPLLDIFDPSDYYFIDDLLTREWFFYTQGAGRVYGGSITANVDGTVDISAGVGLSHITGSTPQSPVDDPSSGQISPILRVEWDACLGSVLTDQAYNYIYYSGSLNSLQTTTDFYSIDFSRDFTLGRAYRDGSTSIVRLCGTNLWNFTRRVQLFGEEVFPIQRANGLIITHQGGRTIRVTGGVLWAELVNRFTTETVDTSTGSAPLNTFTYWYRNGLGGWTRLNSQTQINNTQYDDGTGTLATLANNNRYGAHWVYVVHDSTVHVVFGQGDYASLAAAELATPPSSIPGLLSAYSTLAGRIIIQRNATTFASITSAFDKNLGLTAITNHNDLGGLQGGTSGEYYHLTQAQSADFVGKAYVDGSLNLRTTFTYVDGSLNVRPTFAYVDGSLATKQDILTSIGEIPDVSIAGLGAAQDGSSLVYRHAQGVWTYGPGGSGGAGSTTFSGLTDVSIKDVSNNDAILYDFSTGKWKNIRTLDVSLYENLSGLKDVSIAGLGSAQDGSSLVYNHAQARWTYGRGGGGTTINKLNDIGDVSAGGNPAVYSVLQYADGSLWTSTPTVDASGLFQPKIIDSSTKASNATGTPGQMAYDASYLYVCTSTNVWGRILMQTGY